MTHFTTEPERAAEKSLFGVGGLSLTRDFVLSILGSPGVGKTCFVVRLAFGNYVPEYDSSVEGSDCE